VVKIAISRQKKGRGQRIGREDNSIMEKVKATLRNGNKVILENIEVAFGVSTLSAEHKVLEGSFNIPINKSLAPGLYELHLENGRSYQVFVKSVHSDFKKGVKVSFIGEVEG
jgi:hypothetical protein